MTVVIDHERFGMKQEFEGLKEAQQAIRDCGPDFADVVLRRHGNEVVAWPGGQRVGYVMDRPPVKKWDGNGLPIRPTEVLPNGATVVDIRWTAPPPSERRRWYVLCVWLRGGSHEYIVWELFPDMDNACEHGSYTRELLHAEKILTERLE